MEFPEPLRAFDTLEIERLSDVELDEVIVAVGAWLQALQLERKRRRVEQGGSNGRDGPSVDDG